MSASEYICKVCKEVKTAGMLGRSKKYKCPKHGFICPDCVDSGIFKTTCKTCEAKVVKFSWNGKKGKWINS